MGKKLDADERVRLLYVATTRARDHLVLSMYRSSSDASTDAGKIAAILEDATAPWEPVREIGGQASVPEPAPTNTDPMSVGSLADRDHWIHSRQELLHRQGRPLSVAATRLARVSKEETQTGEPWRRGRAGTALGRAVHAVLQVIDLATGEGIVETSRAQAAAEGISGQWREVVRLAQNAVTSPTVRRAVVSRLWREGVLEGYIDLMFEAAGGLALVDYKTDAVDSVNIDHTLSRYRLQGGAYALAIERATGFSVTEVVFLFLHANVSRSLTDIPALTAQAEDAATTVLATPV